MSRELIERIGAVLNPPAFLDNDAAIAALLQDCKAALSQEAEPVADWAFQTIAEYEECSSFKVNEAFRIGWDMARTTNRMLGLASPKPVPLPQPVASVPQDDEEFYRVYNRLFSRRGADTKHMAECEEVWNAAIATKKIASAPQDVDQWIEKWKYSLPIPVMDDLRAWMAGHARVPGDILGISEFALRRLQFDTPKNGTDYELITRALNVMLAASKESESSAASQQEGV